MSPDWDHGDHTTVFKTMERKKADHDAKACNPRNCHWCNVASSSEADQKGVL